MASLPTKALASIPAGLRTPLLKCFNEICRNFAERRWEPSELNGGKFCEVVYRVLEGQATEKYAKKPTKPRNMVDACRKLENGDPKKVPRGFRILVPRMLPALYEIRNNRGVGHEGGDVDSNEMDATAVLYTAKWIMAELVRVFHDLTTEEAQAVVEALVERQTPMIWSSGAKRRVLDPGMTKKDETLVLLYATAGTVSVKSLVEWTEYSNPSVYRSAVLKPMHKKRLIEFDAKTGTVELLPPGSKDVEDRLLNK